MGNKDSDEAGVHGRPCCYCFEMDGYFWMVPISSKTEKYKKIYEEKRKRCKEYDGLRFGYVNGQYRAFLIPWPLSAEINGIARKAIRLNKKGVRIVLTNPACSWMIEKISLRYLIIYLTSLSVLFDWGIL